MLLFGYEHIFREFSQIYQAVESNSESVSKLDQEDQLYMFKLPKIMAKLHVFHGLPLELMDGEVAFVPLPWVQAVLREIEKLIGGENKTSICDFCSWHPEFWEVNNVERDVRLAVWCECRSMHQRSLLSDDSS